MVSSGRIEPVYTEGGLRFLRGGEYASNQWRIHRGARYKPGVFLRVYFSAEVVQRQHAGVYFYVGKVIAALKCVGSQNAQAVRQ